MTSTFGQQLKIGQKGEKELDQVFSEWYEIRTATRQQDESGIDRIFTGKKTKKTLAIQYKTDTHDSNNAFIELIGDCEEDRLGWAYQCSADLIIYYFQNRGDVYLFKPSDLQDRLDLWLCKYEIKTIQKNTWHTKGLLLPLTELATISKVIYAYPTESRTKEFLDGRNNSRQTTNPQIPGQTLRT